MSLKAARMAAVLLVIGAGLLTVGVTVERRESGGADAAETQDESAERSESEASEGSEEAEGAGNDESIEEGERSIFGVDPESGFAVVAALLVSLAAAVALWVTKRRSAALAVTLLGLVFTFFDLPEVADQLDEASAGLAALAIAVAVAHLGAAVAGAWAATTARPDVTRTA